MKDSCVALGVEIKARDYLHEMNISINIYFQNNNILFILLIPIINISTRYTPEEYL
jgi:hypothetical protein